MSIIGFDPDGHCVLTPTGRTIHWSPRPHVSRFVRNPATLCGKKAGVRVDGDVTDITCRNCLNAIPSAVLAVSGVDNGKQSPTNGSLPRGTAVHPDAGAVGTDV